MELTDLPDGLFERLRDEAWETLRQARRDRHVLLEPVTIGIDTVLKHLPYWPDDA